MLYPVGIVTNTILVCRHATYFMKQSAGCPFFDACSIIHLGFAIRPDIILQDVLYIRIPTQAALCAVHDPILLVRFAYQPSPVTGRIVHLYVRNDVCAQLIPRKSAFPYCIVVDVIVPGNSIKGFHHFLQSGIHGTIPFEESITLRITGRRIACLEYHTGRV